MRKHLLSQNLKSCFHDLLYPHFILARGVFVFTIGTIVIACSGSNNEIGCQDTTKEDFVLKKNTIFEISEDQSLAIDMDNRLVWKRCEVGKNYENKRCKGEVELMTWPEAMVYVNEYNAENIKKYNINEQWRLPTTEEIMTLYHCENNLWNQNFRKENDTLHTWCTRSVYYKSAVTDDENNIDNTIFPNTYGHNWTIDPNLNDTNGSGGMSVSFHKSLDNELNSWTVDSEYRSQEASVRLVRPVVWGDETS